MKMDTLKLDTYDCSYDSVHKSISMMNDFITKSFPYVSYEIDQIDDLDLQNNEKQIVAKILSCKSEHIHREFIGASDGRMYFINRMS